ncbi:hypothetical protein ACNTMW_33515 [Planosporangium sp. 12N6]|uniref:hypothetical protein n=1 Tax=Planosporangium spinosum TaxID=3402278 RepID=UPI003CF2E4CD
MYQRGGEEHGRTEQRDHQVAGRPPDPPDPGGEQPFDPPAVSERTDKAAQFDELE